MDNLYGSAANYKFLTMKIILVILLFSSLAIAQDSTKPFTYKGDGVWETKTETVREIDLKLRDLEAKTEEVDTLQAIVEVYKKMIDGYKQTMLDYREIIRRKDEIIQSKVDLVSVLENPVSMEVKEPFLKFDGVFANIGTQYDIRDKFDVKTLVHFISVDASITIKNKIRVSGEQRYPFFSSVKLGVGF